jgi:hypothetical protein
MLQLPSPYLVLPHRLADVEHNATGGDRYQMAEPSSNNSGVIALLIVIIVLLVGGFLYTQMREDDDEVRIELPEVNPGQP